MKDKKGWNNKAFKVKRRTKSNKFRKKKRKERVQKR